MKVCPSCRALFGEGGTICKACNLPLNKWEILNMESNLD